ncbi:MAG: hypothetical protein ACI9D0_000884 [Bacteroidia bacterium]|jgi:hypothetical protein
MSMRSIIKAAQVQLEGHDVNMISDVGSAASAGKRARAIPKSARLIEIAGVPRAVEVTCSCGEVHLVELDFEEK